MKPDEIKLQFDFNYWLSARILAACEKVTPAQYIAAPPADLGIKSLRWCVVHALSTERQWRLLCRGYFATRRSQTAEDEANYTEEQLPTLEALKQTSQVEQLQMRAFLDTLDEEKLAGTVHYVSESGAVESHVMWHCLYNIVLHGTQHRAEAAALLTLYGASPGDLDFAEFMNERFGRAQN